MTTMPWNSSQPENDKASRPLIAVRDQGSLLALAASLLVMMVSYWLYRGGHRGELIHIDRAPPLQAKFQVDVNRADWPDGSTLQFLEPLVFQECELPEVPFDSRVTPAVDAAERFLLVALASGPRLSRDLTAEAAEVGISRSTLYRARCRLELDSNSGAWALR